MLCHIQQRKLRLPPFEQHGVPFSLVMAESDILMVNVPVASLQLFYQPAFGVSSVPQELRRTDIESQRAKKQTVSPKLAEHGTELPQVFSQERVRLPFRHGVCGIPLAFL